MQRGCDLRDHFVQGSASLHASVLLALALGIAEAATLISVGYWLASCALHSPIPDDSYYSKASSTETMGVIVVNDPAGLNLKPSSPIPRMPSPR